MADLLSFTAICSPASSVVCCLPWLKPGSQLDSLMLQDDAMVTRTAMAEKYKNPQDYEDDFM